MKLATGTRETVEYILNAIKEKLDELSQIEHSGVKGMKWGGGQEWSTISDTG